MRAFKLFIGNGSETRSTGTWQIGQFAWLRRFSDSILFQAVNEMK
jgi:hypothetical protein